MKKKAASLRWILKWLARAIGGIFTFILLLFAYAYYNTAARLNKVYRIPDEPVTLRSDPATLERGKHLISSVVGCAHCHGEDLGGHSEAKIPLFLAIRGPNLTSGEGSVTKNFTDQDWVRAIRHGVKANGTSLFIMPSDNFSKLSQSDLEAIISAAKSYPPVNRKVEPPYFGPLGRLVVALHINNSFIVAEAVDHTMRAPSSLFQLTKGPELGKYLVGVGGCTSCHRKDYSGGRIAGTPSSIPPAVNLTPAGPLAKWTEQDFLKFFRTGIRPDGTQVNEIMPWKSIGKGTDEEIVSIYSYLKTLPAKETQK